MSQWERDGRRWVIGLDRPRFRSRLEELDDVGAPFSHGTLDWRPGGGEPGKGRGGRGKGGTNQGSRTLA